TNRVSRRCCNGTCLGRSCFVAGGRSAQGAAAGNRGSKPSRVHGVDGHVGFVASIDGGRQFRFIFRSQRETTREENHHLASRDAAQIFCQATHGEKHGARAKIRLRIKER